MQERLELIQQINAERDPMRREELVAQQLALAGDLEGLQRQAADAATPKTPRPDVDSLTRIGAFTTGRENPQTNLIREGNRLLKQANQKLGENNQLLREFI